MIPVKITIDPINLNNQNVVKVSKGQYIFQFNGDLNVPEGYGLSFKSVSYTHSFPNLTTDDFFEIEYSTDSGASFQSLHRTDFKLGLYDPDGLQQYIHDNISLTDVHTEVPALEDIIVNKADLVTLEPRYSTETLLYKTQLHEWIDGTNQIRLVISPTVATVMGFEEETDITEESTEGPSRAAFNVVSAVQFHVPGLLGSSFNINNDVLKSDLLYTSQILEGPGEVQKDVEFSRTPIPMNPINANNITIIVADQNDVNLEITNPLILNMIIEKI